MPKTGTRSIPKDIRKTKPRSITTTSRVSVPPPTPPIRSTSKTSTKPAKATPATDKKPPKPLAEKQTLKVKPNKTRLTSEKVKVDKDIKKELPVEPQQDDGVSPIGRIQRLFGSDTNATDTTTAKKKPSNKQSRTPRSVAQKFVSNMFSNPESEEWISVCPKTRLSPGEIVPVEVAGLDLIVVASKDAQNIYCMVNSCPHLGTPLETGFLERRPIEQQPTVTQASTNADFAAAPTLQESDVAALLASDGCEDCIVCPLHKTAFALQSGQVRGEWCPYPPVLGKMMSTVKQTTSAAVFDVRTRGKNIEVRLNTPLAQPTSTSSANAGDEERRAADNKKKTKKKDDNEGDKTKP